MESTETSISKRKTAFIFLAAGGQNIGMGSFLKEYGKDPFNAARTLIDERMKNCDFAESVEDLDKICKEGPENQLHLAHIANTAVCAQAMATYKLLKENDIKPDILAGYSLGEYAAVTAAGCISYETVLPFLYTTSRQYQERFPLGEYCMAAVLGARLQDVEEACSGLRSDGEIYVSSNNGEGYYLVSGQTPSILALKSGFKAKVIPINVYVPSHTPLVREFESFSSPMIDLIVENDPSQDITLVSTRSGEVLSNKYSIRSSLKTHLSSPVRWDLTVDKMLALGVDTFVELGPGYNLMDSVKRMARAVGKEVQTYTTSNKEGFEKVLSDLKLR